MFAAQWDRYDLKLSEGEYSKNILERVIDRYEELNNERGILIEDFDPNEMRVSREINLSELCYGLGYVIAQELSVFFEKITEDICNEIGFQTMLIVFEIPTNKMSDLPNYHKYLKNGDKLENLIKHIIKIYKTIFNKFDKNFASIMRIGIKDTKQNPSLDYKYYHLYK